MRVQFIVTFIGILVVTHLFSYVYIQKRTIQTVRERSAGFEKQIDRVKLHKQNDEKKLHSLIAVLNSLKHWLNTGFKDPETGFVRFLDFVDISFLDKVNAKFFLKNAQKFQKTPVPLQMSSFEVQFDFLHTHEIEKFFQKLLLQHKYPLKVNSVEIHRMPNERTNSNVSMDLLLPVSLINLSEQDLANMGVE